MIEFLTLLLDADEPSTASIFQEKPVRTAHIYNIEKILQYTCQFPYL